MMRYLNFKKMLELNRPLDLLASLWFRYSFEFFPWHGGKKSLPALKQENIKCDPVGPSSANLPILSFVGLSDPQSEDIQGGLFRTLAGTYVPTLSPI